MEDLGICTQCSEPATHWYRRGNLCDQHHALTKLATAKEGADNALFKGDSSYSEWDSAVRSAERECERLGVTT